MEIYYNNQWVATEKYGNIRMPDRNITDGRNVKMEEQ